MPCQGVNSSFNHKQLPRRTLMSMRADATPRAPVRISSDKGRRGDLPGVQEDPVGRTGLVRMFGRTEIDHCRLPASRSPTITSRCICWDRSWVGHIGGSTSPGHRHPAEQNDLVPPSVVLLTTPRLILRRFRDSDTETFASYRSDPAIACYQFWDTPFPIGAARAFVHEESAADPAQPDWFQYAIELRSDGSLAGDVGVNLHDNRMQAEIGFTLAAAHQGHGYATEAVGRVLTQLFTAAGLVRVSAECDARNDRSARLLERLGFRREGAAGTQHLDQGGVDRRPAVRPPRRGLAPVTALAICAHAELRPTKGTLLAADRAKACRFTLLEQEQTWSTGAC